MKSKQWFHWCAVVMVAALAAASCGGSADDEIGEDSADGEIMMGRASWDTGYFQAQIYKQLLEELDYTVSEPSEKELGPNLAYLAMAEGDLDFWANGWYPLHISWLKQELPDQSMVSDHVTVVGNQMLVSGLQGLLVTKSTADEYGITHLDQINNDPDILAAFDAVDSDPGNGKVEIFGCFEEWTCDDILESQIAFSGWENIVQVKAGYDAMFAEAKAKVDAGEPTVIYTWTPSAYILDLRPGHNVVWLAVEDVIDDSNPLNAVGGETHDQRPGTGNLREADCPAVADTGICQLGFTAADIQVTANTEWLNANPMAAGLLCAVRLSVVDVALANLAQTNAGDDATEDFIAGLAADWIKENRATVDGWLDQARSAPTQPSCPDTKSPQM